MKDGNVCEKQILTQRYHYLIEEGIQSASETLSTFHFDLTMNTCRSIHRAICVKYPAVKEGSIESCVTTISRNIAVNEIKQQYVKEFNRKALLASFEKGILSLEIKLPIRLSDDRILWCRQTGSLTRNPINDNVECVLCLLEDDKEIRLIESFRRMTRTDYEFVGNMNLKTGDVTVIYEKVDKKIPSLSKELFVHEDAVVIRMSALVEDEFIEDSIQAMSRERIISGLEENDTYIFSFPANKKMLGHDGVYQWRFGYLGDSKEEVVFSRTEMIGFLDNRQKLQIERSAVQEHSIAIAEAVKTGSGYRNKILIADDSDFERALLQSVFDKEFEIITAKDGEEAIRLIDENFAHITLILLDMQMPKKTGLDVLMHMKIRNMTSKIPVMLVTGVISKELNLRSLEYGISDIVTKPFDSRIIRRRALNLIELYAHKEETERQLEAWKEDAINMHIQAEKSNEFLINALSSVVEFRSLESGLHIKRVRTLTGVMLKTWIMLDPTIKLSDSDIDKIERASMLHDIGKVAIPDSILLKPGKLTPEEFEVMKTHSVIGCDMLKNIKQEDNDFYQYSYDICRYHHERCDGKGYPDGLKGDEIPLWAQIVSIVDVFDALISPRVYKPAYSVEKALEMIRNGECGVFSDELLECFEKAKDLIVAESLRITEEEHERE